MATTKPTIATLVAVLVLCGAWAVEVRAQPTSCAWGVLTVGSYHFDREDRELEEWNWGPGIEQCLGKPLGIEVRTIAGAYRNTNSNDSLYAGALFSFIELAETVKLGAAVIIVSGYSEEVIAAALPVLAIEPRNFPLGLNLTYFHRCQRCAPAGTEPPSRAIGLQLKWRFR